MRDAGDLKRHAALVDRMAEMVGADLEGAVLAGRARIDDISDAVLRCTACSDPDHCTAWLDARAGAERPPGYCRNSALFAALTGHAT